jgi:hypothetical protein
MGAAWQVGRIPMALTRPLYISFCQEIKAFLLCSDAEQFKCAVVDEEYSLQWLSYPYLV